MFPYGQKWAQQSYDKTLVNLVRLNPVLYNTYMRQTSHPGLVEATWAQIQEYLVNHGPTLNADPQKRWNQLRKSFNGHYKKSNVNWHLYNDFLFLIEHTKAQFPNLVQIGVQNSPMANNFHVPKSDIAPSTSSPHLHEETGGENSMGNSEAQGVKIEEFTDYEMLSYEDEIITIDDSVPNSTNKDFSQLHSIASPPSFLHSSTAVMSPPISTTLHAFQEKTQTLPTSTSSYDSRIMDGNNSDSNLSNLSLYSPSAQYSSTNLVSTTFNRTLHECQTKSRASPTSTSSHVSDDTYDESNSQSNLSTASVSPTLNAALHEFPPKSRPSPIYTSSYVSGNSHEEDNTELISTTDESQTVCGTSVKKSSFQVRNWTFPTYQRPSSNSINRSRDNTFLNLKHQFTPVNSKAQSAEHSYKSQFETLGQLSAFPTPKKRSLTSQFSYGTKKKMRIRVNLMMLPH
ncbi:uncharacterized protein LOC127279575 [Leptopilina boulardi]|uniref:uncharacterized protein LOC127279575 n=1 Tax=Leptopilina boulardi TaxID=63433 RepID=UPI0021F5C537|nr:uncharacterized protein LOC127279575 [Leptopilina boulardi]